MLIKIHVENPNRFMKQDLYGANLSNAVYSTLRPALMYVHHLIKFYYTMYTKKKEYYDKSITTRVNNKYNGRKRESTLLAR